MNMDLNQTAVASDPPPAYSAQSNLAMDMVQPVFDKPAVAQKAPPLRIDKTALRMLQGGQPILNISTQKQGVMGLVKTGGVPGLPQTSIVSEVGSGEPRAHIHYHVLTEKIEISVLDQSINVKHAGLLHPRFEYTSIAYKPGKKLFWVTQKKDLVLKEGTGEELPVLARIVEGVFVLEDGALSPSALMEVHILAIAVAMTVRMSKKRDKWWSMGVELGAGVGAGAA